MDLLRYLRKEQLETARQIIQVNPIRVSAPDHPSDLRKLVHASQALQMGLYLAGGRYPEATDLLGLHALPETIRVEGSNVA